MNKIKLLNFKLKKALWQDLFWIYKSKFHQEWLEFAEHKEYTPWDSIKYIDWKNSSKTQKLYVKKFEEEKSIKVLFLVEINKSYYYFPNKLELLQEVIFTLWVSALHNKDQLFINNKPIKNFALLNNFIEKLETNNTTPSLENLIWANAKNKQIKDFLIFIISDTDKLPEKELKLLSIKNEIYFIHIFDKFENNLASENCDIILTNKIPIKISLSNKQKIQQYRQLRQEKLKKIENTLNKLQIKYLYLDTSLDPFKELLKLFL